MRKFTEAFMRKESPANAQEPVPEAAFLDWLNNKVTSDPDGNDYGKGAKRVELTKKWLAELRQTEMKPLIDFLVLTNYKFEIRRLSGGEGYCDKDNSLIALNSEAINANAAEFVQHLIVHEGTHALIYFIYQSDARLGLKEKVRFGEFFHDLDTKPLTDQENLLELKGLVNTGQEWAGSNGAAPKQWTRERIAEAMALLHRVQSEPLDTNKEAHIEAINDRFPPRAGVSILNFAKSILDEAAELNKKLADRSFDIDAVVTKIADAQMSPEDKTLTNTARIKSILRYVLLTQASNAMVAHLSAHPEDLQFNLSKLPQEHLKKPNGKFHRAFKHAVFEQMQNNLRTLAKVIDDSSTISLINAHSDLSLPDGYQSNLSSQTVSSLLNALASIGPEVANKAGITFDKLREIEDPYDRKDLISPRAVQAYNFGVTFDQLRSIESPQDRYRFTTSAALSAYEAGMTFDQLKALGPRKLAALTCIEAADIYQLGVTTFAQLSAIENLDTIKVLTDPDALRAYKAGVPFDKLGAIKDPDTIWYLISPKTLEAYKAGISFDELSAIKEPKKIEALASPEALKAYKAGTSFAQLAQLYDKDARNFKKLVSEQSTKAVSVISEAGEQPTAGLHPGIPAPDNKKQPGYGR